MPELPFPVSEAFAATNAGDLARFTAAFAADGVVDDSRREFRGREAIARWSRAESIGLQQRFVVVAAREDDGRFVVTAEVGGGGYNGPATFTFDIAPGGDAIQRMAISG